MTSVQKSLTGGVIYSHFRYLCPYQTWLNFNIPLPEEAISPSDRLLMRSGIRHEEEALQYFLKKYGDNCAVIDGEEGLDMEQNIRLRADQTMTAMKEGRAIIYHGILAPYEGQITVPGLPADRVLRGETDFLFRVDAEDEGLLGKYHYEVGDAKSSRSSKFCQQMQVTFYSWLLEPLQGIRPKFGRILTRPLGIESEYVPFKEERFLIDDTIWTLRSFMEEEFQEILNKHETDFFFHPGSACATCSYYDYCLERVTAVNDLSLLPDIRRIQKRQLNRVGINDIGALAEADDEILKKTGKATGVTYEGLDRLRCQARASINAEPVLRGVFDSPREACLTITASELDLPGDQVDTLAIDFADPALVHVHFDMESDPYSGTEYLFGLMVDVPEKEGKRKLGNAEYFTAHSHSPDDEYGAFQSFLRRMEAIRERYGDERFVIFHYAHYEPVHLMKLAEKYQDRSENLVERVDYLNRRMVDLYKLIRKTYYLPVLSYSIKDVAPCIRTLMAQQGLSGGHEWKKIKTLEELKQELLKSGWANQKISESMDEVRQAMVDFELDDETLLFDASADMSVVWFNLYTQRRNPIWMKLIQIYNADDLLATRALVEWFLFMEQEASGR